MSTMTQVRGETVVLVLLGVAVVAGLAAVTGPGTAAAERPAANAATLQPTGTVDVDDTIYTDQTEFEVTVTELQVSGDGGCVVVSNSGGGSTQLTLVREGDTETVTEADVGRFDSGDVIDAELQDRSKCGGDVLDEDQTTVEQTGTVAVEDTVYADQSSFEVAVTELRNDRSFGCVVVSNSGGESAQFTGVETGDRLTVTEADVGSFRYGDDLDAELQDVGKCGGEVLDTDSTTVTATGDLDIEDPIYADRDVFSVDVTSLRTDSGEGCVAVYKNGTQAAARDPVQAGDTVAFTESEVDGIADGDAFEALLGGSFCEEELASDATTVTETGSVAVQEPIHAADSEFDVEVTELHVDGEAGCLRVENSGGGDTIVTDVADGDTATVAGSDVGGYEVGDVVTVTIVDQPNCGGVDLDADSTTVSQGPTATPTATPMETATPTETATPAETATATPTPTDASDPSDGGAARFEVMIDEVRVSEREGSLEVDATVENTGDAAETQTVVLSMDGEELGSRELTLGNGESESVTFSSEAPADGGERDLRVASEDDSDQSSVQLQDDDSGTGFLPENSGAFFLLLLLLLALLVAYYYVRSRRYQSDQVPVDEGE